MSEIEKKPALLLVDDDPGVLTIHETVLKTKFEVVKAENGAIAWQLFQQRPFAVVVTDIAMPEMDGHELIQNIRQNRSNAQIIIVSRMTDDEVNMWSAFGVIHFVKPVLDLNYLSLAANISYQRHLGVSSRQWLESLEELMADPPAVWFNTLKGLIGRFEQNKAEIGAKLDAVKELYDNRPPDWLRKIELVAKSVPSQWLQKLENLIERAPWK